MTNRRIGKKYSESYGGENGGGADKYKGNWDASTNTPFLVDGVGDAGDYYDVSVAGTQDLGSGPITFTVNDEVKYNGTRWFKRDKPETLWTDTGSEAKLVTPRPINTQDQGLKNSHTTSPIRLASATDPELTTTKKDYAGGINEVKLNSDNHAAAANPHSDSASTTDLINHTSAANPHSGSAASGANNDISSLEGISGAVINEWVQVLTAAATHNQGVTAKAVMDAIAAGSGLTPQDLTEQLAGGGETEFTLAEAPKSPISTILNYNGQIPIYGYDYTIDGTTLIWISPDYPLGSEADGNKLWILSDITITPPGTIDQQKMFYVGKAGNDSNNGKSVEKPFLTIAAACAAVLAAGPTELDSYAIQVIDGGIYAETGLNLPLFTKLDMSRAIFEGTITLGNGSAFHFKEIRVPASSTAITKTGAGHPAYVQGDTVSSSVNATLFDVSDTSRVYAFIPRVDMNQVGSKIANVGTTAELFINSCVWDENVASTNDGTALAILEQVSKAPFKAWTNVQHSGTGATTPIVVQFGAKSYDQENTFSIITNREAAKYPGIYSFTVKLWLGAINPVNNYGRVSLVRRNSGGTIVETLILYNQNIGAEAIAATGYFRDSWTDELKLNKGDTVEVELLVTGGATDTVQVFPSGSTFAGHLVTPII